MIALILGTVIMLVIASSFAFLMQHSPGTGGVYTYTREAFGRDHAFLSSWFLCLSYLTIVFLNGTALFIVFRTLTDGVMTTGLHYTVAGHEIYLVEVLVSMVAFAGIGFLFLVAKPFLQKLFSVLAFILLAGVTVSAVFCAPYALSAFRLTPDTAAAPGTYDAILMDIQMPVMDGYAATRAIRALPDPEKASVPILALTANAFAEDVQAAKDAGMQAHIAKPIDLNLLSEALRTVLNKDPK